MTFEEPDLLDPADFPEYARKHPAIINAKNNWKQLAEVVLGKRKGVPLTEMCLKVKHEDQIFSKM